MAATTRDYPVTLTVDYPDRKMNRLTSFFRVIVIIPIAIVIALLVGSDFGSGAAKEAAKSVTISSAGLVVFSLLLMIPFARNIPAGGLTGTWHLAGLSCVSAVIWHCCGMSIRLPMKSNRCILI